MRLRELKQTKQALGGEVSLTVIADIAGLAIDEIFNNLWRQVYTFERQFSRFLPMSELSAFNRAAGIKSFITPQFKELLEAAKNYSISTNGLYNPFILPALQRAGYVQSAAAGYENDIQENYSFKQVVSIDHLIIDGSYVTIPYGTALDMGGCGKGFLADKLGEYLESLNIKGYLLNLGGDIATYGLDENGQKMTLNIQSAETLSKVSDWVVECAEGYTAVATSGTFKRKSQLTDKNWHHIIDPLSLKPAITDIRLATIVAEPAIKADILASCAVILGSKKALSFLKSRGVSAALLQCYDNDGNYFEKKFGSQIKKYAKTGHTARTKVLSDKPKLNLQYA